MNIKSDKDRQNSVLFDTDRLRSSRVLLIGLGGLGSPTAFALAGGGVGSITLCDSDRVSAENLNRQTLYSACDIGESKVKASFDRLSAFAPDCKFDCLDIFVGEENAAEITDGFDLVILAVDNNKVRFEVNKACVKNKIKLMNIGISGVYGSIYLYEPDITPCLSCVLSDTESPDKRTSAAPCGIIGSFAAMRALDALCGNDRSKGKLTVIDCREATVDSLSVRRRCGCNICGGEHT